MIDPLLQRSTDQMDGAYALAILYTLGYFIFLGLLMFVPIPGQNKELMLTLAGILSAAQLGIIKYFYDGSKSADKVQSANIARSVKSEAVVQDIAKAAAPVAAAAVAANVAAVAAAVSPGATPIPVVQPDAAPVAPDPQPPKGDTQP